MAGSINLANVAIGFDASQIKRGVDMSAGEMRKLGSIVRDSVSPLDKYNQQMDLLRKASDAGALSTKRMAEAQDFLKKKYLEVGESTKSSTNGLIAMTARYASVAAAATAVKKSVGMAAELETNKAAFEVLTGSAGKAEMLLQNFVKLDAQSPLSKGEFARGAKTLMGFGVDADLVSSRMENLGQISMGNAERFQSLSLAFGQVTAAGKLTGQEVLQMVNAGFNPLQQISESTGRSMQDLRAAMERGEISTRMVADALDDATEKGGRFFGMNEKLLDTASGKYAKLQSSISQTATEIGSNLLPAAKSLMDLLNSPDAGAGGGFLSRFSETFGVGVEGISAMLQYEMGDGGKAADKMTDRIAFTKAQRELEASGLKHKNTPEEEERIKKMAMDRQEKKMAEQKAIEEAAAVQKRADEDRGKRIAEQWKKTNEEIEAKTKERERMEKKIAEDSKKVYEDTMRPEERMIAEMERLQALFDAGGIDQATLGRGNKEAESKFRKEMNPLNVSDTIAPALKAGSVEAYKFMLNQKDKIAEIAERSFDVAQQQLDVQKQQLEVAKQQPKLARKA